MVGAVVVVVVDEVWRLRLDIRSLQEGYIAFSRKHSICHGLFAHSSLGQRQRGTNSLETAARTTSNQEG